VIAMRTPEMTIARAKNAEGREFRAIYLAAFVLFLAAVVVTRFLPPKWRPWPPSADRARSVLAEARAAASAFVPFAMMG
jgi:hypothetical protein